MDAMTFFQKSAGKWRSKRTTHHLAFRRAELGNSEIFIEALPPDHPKVIEICQLHEFDPTLTVGGAFVSWDGTMAWDKQDENHEGSTVFALIPDKDADKKGILLRDRGYAEIVPVAGQYNIDEEEALVLVTEYETMSIVERFWFAAPNIRMRTSAVKRFGGFNSATFCTEIKVEGEEETPDTNAQIPDNLSYSLTGW
ncbi:MAG: phycobiliprotein lyase [Microcystaceae cyanobacterium]